ncbi:acyl carrier protein [Marnyiella aurantia]|uniref:Acyl carrier protein n=1 Tax=Marnyiella aurantia TaxID=2758037 RepID=A0A7D7LND2_9FLAO|nr:acyl carrier protein [Marnyiella aurantia]MBA5247448.1 acyl carrier protein [Marnyiella aurantia]QMS99204.1 acyl carrier protein [Marnyiella aurantia]
METRIKNVMASVFEMPAEQINAESSPDNIENWDSLKHLNLVVALEEEFDIEFDDDEALELMSFSSIYDLVKAKA